MKFSILTPTHLKNHYLTELHESLKAQIHTNWEWVIVINNNNEGRAVPEDIENDQRVVIITDDNSSDDSIGRLKKMAAKKSTGDILVEVDHDDMLTEDALSEMERVFENEGTDFAYSNSIYLSDEFIPYNPAFGWTHYQVDYRGKKRFVMNSFPPSSRSFSFIWYCPNHVRAWKREFYFSIGGHDESYEVCDDHEILIRTYLYGNISFISKPLYVYRITGENTWLQKNRKVQETTVKLFHQYAHKLAMREAFLKGQHVINLKDHDLDQPLPFDTSSVGVLFADQILKDYEQPYEKMREIYRVLADCGWAFICVPSTDGRGAFQDPFTKSWWNENSFLYYTNQTYAEFINNNEIRFQPFRLDTEIWAKNIAMTHAWLTAIKSNTRRPHTVEI